MKIFVLMTIARQVEGDMVQVRIEKAYQALEQAQEHMNSLAKTYLEHMDVPSQGGIEKIEFFCERSIHEVNVE